MCGYTNPTHDWSAEIWDTSIQMLLYKDKDTIDFVMMRGIYGNELTDNIFTEEMNEDLHTTNK